ncbi:hypothetical protein HGRIS_011847 [Hohenbuehelia grisea]|uniref:Uncharacterized protein n=1 Tax=Hohenbuehelia grisea TaxID=104357 RepID=A0ABR3JWB8_9AGAR
MRYWDGQPVRFLCCERKGSGEKGAKSEEPWGRILWCVVISLDEEEEEEETGGSHDEIEANDVD